MAQAAMLSICIPVGPQAHYKRYLRECLESVKAQTVQPHDVVLVDDMAGLTAKDLEPLLEPGDTIEEHANAPIGDCRGPTIMRPDGQLAGDTSFRAYAKVWRSPWRLGIPACANVAYALAASDLAFQLSCDDRLMPNCVERLQAEWDKCKDVLGFYWVDIEYSTGEKQALPCGHAMVHKRLWQHTGGYPPESGVGACDHIFMNWALQHPNDIHLIHVDGGPLYWHREHEAQYTKHQRVSPTTIADVREGFNKTWQAIDGLWGRYE